MLVVVTGGARSGKSGVAQAMAAGRGGPVTVVVFGDATGDPEMDERIERHREDRPDGWTTVEPRSAEGWLDDVAPGALLLVDCLGTLLGRVMEDVWAEDGSGPFGGTETLPGGYAERVGSRLAEVIESLLARDGDTIVVTNEVGDGVVPAFASGRLFRDALGRANRSLVDRADAAWLVVAGRCVDLNALPRDARWPED